MSDVDGKTKLKLKELTQERMAGRYKDDIDGFVAAFREVSANAQTSEKVEHTPGLFDTMGDGLDAELQGSIHEMFEDRSRFRAEVNEQLASRVNQFKYLTERKASDFVKPQVSEVRAYDQKKYSMSNDIANKEARLARMEDDQAAEGDDFNREAFDQLKEELRQRKAAKETLLNGSNMPQFKSYLRF